VRDKGTKHIARTCAGNGGPPLSAPMQVMRARAG
jgi:hypothetical protein